MRDRDKREGFIAKLLDNCNSTHHSRLPQSQLFGCLRVDETIIFTFEWRGKYYDFCKEEGKKTAPTKEKGSNAVLGGMGDLTITNCVMKSD